jgi:hypothetical protein
MIKLEYLLTRRLAVILSRSSTDCLLFHKVALQEHTSGLEWKLQPFSEIYLFTSLNHNFDDDPTEFL